MSHLSNTFTFVGPAPRYMIAELMGNVKDGTFYLKAPSSLNLVREAILQQFGVDHTSYAVQVNPCDLCHFCTLMRPDKLLGDANMAADPSTYGRAGSISLSRLSLLNLARVEEENIKMRLFHLAPLAPEAHQMRHFSERWANYSVEQRAWIARFLQYATGAKFGQLKDAVREVGGHN